MKFINFFISNNFYEFSNLYQKLKSINNTKKELICQLNDLLENNKHKEVIKCLNSLDLEFIDVRRLYFILNVIDNLLKGQDYKGNYNCNDSKNVGKGKDMTNDIGKNDIGKNDIGKDDPDKNDINKIDSDKIDINKIDSDKIDINKIDINKIDSDNNNIENLVSDLKKSGNKVYLLSENDKKELSFFYTTIKRIIFDRLSKEMESLCLDHFDEEEKYHLKINYFKTRKQIVSDQFGLFDKNFIFVVEALKREFNLYLHFFKCDRRSLILFEDFVFSAFRPFLTKLNEYLNLLVHDTKDNDNIDLIVCHVIRNCYKRQNNVVVKSSYSNKSFDL
ncbi:hypothetical protein DMUE_0138 [Dictyocoela muelleri]|nr:hypothetical protein DMUE_0138 [Dictyocoela muelleri]